MKVLILAVFTACVALSSAAPATQVVDWTAVAQKVGKIEQDITRAVQEVKATANADNAEVGEIVARKIDAAAVRARNVLESANQAIRDQTLTQSRAQGLFNALQGIFTDLQQILASEIARLSPEAGERIRNTLSGALEEVTVTAREVLALLEGTKIQVIDWTAVQNKLHEIRDGMTAALGQVKNISTADNPTVGSAVEAKLNAASSQAYAILGRTEGLIKDQTLTEAQAQSNLNQLKSILENVQADLQTELAQLSAAAVEQIRNVFNAAYAAAEQQARDMLELLRQ